MHQYLSRNAGRVIDEELFGDRIVRFLYSRVRERAPRLFALALSPRVSSLLGWLNFDLPLVPALLGNRRFLGRCGLDLSECLQPPEFFTTPRRIFERQIDYVRYRPLPEGDGAVVCPADARLLLGSLAADSPLLIKDKFFAYPELLGRDRSPWHQVFAAGEFAAFRLTPDKYHYNHLPVSGRVVDFYRVDGCHHSCHPAAVVAVATPYSANERVVTIIDSDVEGGSGVGRVAMIEITALMIGQVVQCYSERGYADPRPLEVGMMVKRGCPKSLYRPGSSTDILLFEPGRIEFAADLRRLRQRTDPQSAYARLPGGYPPEIDVRVRSLLARPAGSEAGG